MRYDGKEPIELAHTSKIGRIFQEDSFIPDSEYSDFSEGSDGVFSQPEGNDKYDVLDSILNYAENREEVSSNFESYGSETYMRSNNQVSEDITFEDISSAKVKKIKKGRSRGKKVFASIVSILKRMLSAIIEKKSRSTFCIKFKISSSFFMLNLTL